MKEEGIMEKPERNDDSAAKAEQERDLDQWLQKHLDPEVEVLMVDPATGNLKRVKKATGDH